MHQVANSVLIFDEIQTLPVRCVHMLNNALNFLVDHCGSTVVLCTATQPLLHRVDAGKGAIRLSEKSCVDISGNRFYFSAGALPIAFYRFAGTALGTTQNV